MGQQLKVRAKRQRKVRRKKRANERLLQGKRGQ